MDGRHGVPTRVADERTTAGSVAIPTGLRLDEVGPVLDALAAAMADSPRTAALLRGARGGLPTPVA